MNSDLVTAGITAGSVILGAGVTAWWSQRTATAQGKAAAEVAARGPRKQAYAEFIHAVRHLVDDLIDLLPDPGDEGDASPGQVRYVCEQHYPRIDTAHAVVQLEGPDEATEAATAVLDQVGELLGKATEVDISLGDEYGYPPGFTTGIHESLSIFAKTGSAVLNRSAG